VLIILPFHIIYNMKAIQYLLVLAILAMASCRPAKELQYLGIQNLSMEQGTPPKIALDIRLYNPNKYKLKLKNSDVEVFLNGTSVGKLRVEGQHQAPKLDTFMLPVNVDMSPGVLLQSLMPIIMSGNVQIKLTGVIKGGRHGIYIKVPVNFEGNENLLSNMK